MLEIVQNFAGISPINKSLAIDKNILYCIASSNLLVCNDQSISKIHHFDSALSCVAAHSGVVALGDVIGNIIILNSYTKSIGSKIVDCCFINSSLVVFCTIDSIHILNTQTFEIFYLKVDFLITSVASIDSKLLIGSNLGGLYLYSFDCTINLILQIDAHLDCIKNIKVCTNNIATCSQDYNVKVWQYNDSNISLIQTLNGHSDWVNGLYWHNNKLYSASSDKTLRVWEKNENEFYVCADIFGAVSELLSVGVLNEKLIIQAKSGGIDIINEDRAFKYFISGHQEEVTDIDWNKNLLLSCSLDRTVRLFYLNNECARSQIHGFPMVSAKFLPGPKLRIISAGQETIIRIFEGTLTFFRQCEHLKDQFDCLIEDDFLEQYTDRDGYVESAFLSELNLTNEITNDICEEPLSESYLSSNVFKEYQKIYGHYFEIKNIAVGTNLILSCNKSAIKKFAGLFVWDLNGNKLQYIEEHDLDIQKIAISPNETFAVTVGRDQMVCLYSIDCNKLSTLQRFNVHKRIVWDCRFSRNSEYFVTCSRDRKLVLYDTSTQSVIKTHEYEDEITTVDFSPKCDLLIAGTLGGDILCIDYELNVLSKIKVASKKVNIARFDESGTSVAIGGADGLLRILKLNW